MIKIQNIFKNLFIGLLIIFCRLSYADTLISSIEIVDSNRSYIFSESINDLGEFEITVSLKDNWRVFKNSSQIILVGRSISGNRHIDLWFLPTKEAILKVVTNIPKNISNDNLKSAFWVLNKEMTIAERWFALVALESIGESLSMAANHDLFFKESIKRQQMDLLDLEYRMQKLKENSPKDPKIEIGIRTILSGWKEIYDSIDTENSSSIWAYAAGDVAVLWFGGKIIAGLGYIIGKVGNVFIEKYALSQNQLYQQLLRLINNLKLKINNKINRISSRYKIDLPEPINKIKQNFIITQLSIREQVVQFIKAQENKSIIAKALIKTFNEIIAVTKSGFGQSKYVAMTQSMQIISEASARPEDLFDPNPIIMTKKLINDKEFIQNFTYMTNETFWMASIVSRYQSSFTKRVMLCGILAAIDSAFTNLVIKGNVDRGRVMLDSSWEIFVGNLQAQIDVPAIKYFEELAKKDLNPKLKFIGYAFALVDQGVGYFAYAKSSEYYTKKLASENDNSGRSSDLSTTAPSNNQLNLKLIPILAPID